MQASGHGAIGRGRDESGVAASPSVVCKWDGGGSARGFFVLESGAAYNIKADRDLPAGD